MCSAAEDSRPDDFLVGFPMDFAPRLCQGWMLKYLWAWVGFVQLAVPIFTKEQAVSVATAGPVPAAGLCRRRGRTAQGQVGEATQSFVTNRALMTRLADATERLMG